MTLKERDALKLAVQPTLFGDDEKDAEVYKYEKNFRRQLKARLLDQQVVTQLVRESTLAPGDFLNTIGQPRRQLEDPATVAWKLCSGSYYKSGGRPWQIAAMRTGVCYVGLVYKKQNEDDASSHSVCAAQMFLSDGEGVVFRGALGPWFHPESKQFHLDELAAARLVPELTRLLAIAKEQAEEAHRQWEEQQRVWEEQRQRERRETAKKSAQKDLAEAIAAWDEYRKVEAYFSAITQAAESMDSDTCDAVLERVNLAKELVPLEMLLRWKTPEERL